jgi:acetyl/propionyl-CoA carboxylase alpha subunit
MPYGKGADFAFDLGERAAMVREVAGRLATAVDHVGAGTIEFIADASEVSAPSEPRSWR